MPSCIVEADSAVYLPFGFTPIVFPFQVDEKTPTPVKKRKASGNSLEEAPDHAIYAVNVFLDSSADCECGHDASRYAVTSMVSAQSRLPNSFRELPAVKQWRARLEASLVAESGVDA